MSQAVAVLCFSFLVAGISGASAASFDCRRAASADEIAVCADPGLSELDDQINVAFAQARRASGEQVVGIGRRFLASRRSCGADRACLAQVYNAMADAYRGLGAHETLGVHGPGLPRQIGDCVTTSVTDVTPRLDPGRRPTSEDFDSGTAVDFANGGRGVSYEREPALLSSRAGDPIRMCLVSVPKDCPPDDDRGRVYSTTNLRTRQGWTLPDSQHSCGGA